MIAVCRQIGDKWQSKTLFLAIFYPRLSIVKIMFDCRLSGVDRVLSREINFNAMIYASIRYKIIVAFLSFIEHFERILVQ